MTKKTDSRNSLRDRIITALFALTLVFVLIITFNTYQIYVANIYTGYLFILCFFVALYYLGLIILDVSRVKNNKWWKFSVISLLLVVLIMESLIRASGLFNSYFEQRSYYYQSVYYHNSPARQFRDWAKNHDFRLKVPEFDFPRKGNSLGFSDEEFRLEKDSNEYRILALGDSFTEGDGAAAEDAWPSVLERELGKDYPELNIVVYNAGMCGSDHVYSAWYFLDTLSAYHPDLVIAAVNSSDIQDYISNGGFSRFSNQTWPEGPWWEFAYAYSHFARAMLSFMGYNHFLINDKEYLNKAQETADTLAYAQSLITDVMQQRDRDAMVVFHPMREELDKSAYIEHYQLIIDAMKKDGRSHFVDVFPYFREQQPDMQKLKSKMFWEVDGHYNKQGYHMMAQAIRRYIIDKALIEKVFPDKDEEQVQ